MALEFVVGAGIICFLLLYLAFNMDKQHQYLKLLFVGLFAFSLLYVPKALMDDNEYCMTVLNNTKETYIYGNNFSGYHWDYDYAAAPDFNPSDKAVYLFHKEINNTYQRACFNNTNGTALSLFKFVNWITRLFIIYLILYAIWYSVGWKILEKIGINVQK